MDYYEDYEAYAAVYEDEISGRTWTQQDLDDFELKSQILMGEYDIDKDIAEMLEYDPNLYKEDYERVFGKGE